jgi:hypothetical protein
MSVARRRNTSRAQREQLKPELFTLPEWSHPELIYWIDDYKRIRDTIAGSKEVKAERDLYLPTFEGMEDDEYESYLDRATFYNFTGRTLKALVGSVLRRKPVLKNLPERLEKGLETLTNDNQTFAAFSQFALEEALSVGRFAILADLPAKEQTTPQPYLTGYIAENILDWDEEIDEDTGRLRLTRVVLRELHRGTSDTGKQQYFARYRVLRLQNGVYSQELFVNNQGHAELTEGYSRGVVVPRVKGKALDFIPLFIVGRAGSMPAIKTPPLQDIAQLNISHYQSYAQLEQGRYYTGFPIYQVENDGTDTPEFEIGANRVWITQKGCQARLLEFNGQGLKFLENALDIKEQQAASLGGRMMGVRTVASSESDNTAKLKERNEQALLLDIATRCDEAFTFAMRVWAWMSGISREEVDKILVEFNKDFLFDGIGAREFRAIHAMYKDGIITVDVVYHYLRKGDVIPDWMTLDEFKTQLENYEKSFPNQPDAEARADGFPDKKTQLGEDRADEEAEAAEEQAELDRRSQEKQAREAPRPAPGSPNPRPNPRQPQ